MLFCCKNAEKGVGQNVGQLPAPHRDPQAEMRGKSRRAPERKLSPFRCSACLRDLSNLRHEAAHFLRGLLLHLSCGVGVGAERKAGVIVAEHTADGFDVHAILQCQRCEGMPLRYNYDKPEKPRISRVFGYLARFFHPFPNRKIEPRSSYIVGGVIVTTKTKYRLGGQSAHPRNQDISSEKKKCPFFVPKIRCRQEEYDD